MGGFDGPSFKMVDGSSVQTKVIDTQSSSTEISPYLSQIHDDSIQNSARMISFEVEWNFDYAEQGKKCTQRLSSVKVSTKELCLLIKLTNINEVILKDLCKFFSTKQVSFAGVQIEEDVSMLKEIHGIVIRTVVDLSPFAAEAYGTPLHKTSGVRELARRILSCDLTRLDSIQSKWSKTTSDERLEAGAIEGWLVLKIFQQLSW